MFSFYTPRKRQKIKGFLKFSGGIEMDHWIKMGYHERASLSGNEETFDSSKEFLGQGGQGIQEKTK